MKAVSEATSYSKSHAHIPGRIFVHVLAVAVVLVTSFFDRVHAGEPTVWKSNPKNNSVPDVVVWYNATLDKHQPLVDQYAKQGYRSISLCLYGDHASPNYAAVMIKRPTLIATKQYDSMNAATWQQTFNDMSKQGYGPYIVTATGSGQDALFAAVFREMTPTPLTRHNMTAADFIAENNRQMAAGNILAWVDSYGTPTDTRFIAVWHPNVDNSTWNCDAVDVDAVTNMHYYNALTSVWARPKCIAMTPSMHYVEMYDDTTIGHWESEHGMTSDTCTKIFDKALSRGVVPVRFVTKGSGNQVRFAAIFNGRENADPRVWKTTGSAAVADIDKAVQAVMKANQVRGASLAIVQDTRLVYARGYTWAEDAYPTVQPTTYFRQASCSKMFTALAIYQLIHEKKLTLDTKMQNILQLKTPSGGEPADPRFNAITIRHLLEHTSGLDVSLLWEDGPVSQAFPPAKLPVHPNQMASYVASEQLAYTPGDMTKQAYNNTGYFMLGQIVAKLRSSSSFVDAIQTPLLKPLGINRTTTQGLSTIRESRTLVNTQLPDEARYHSRPLAVNPIAVIDGTPLGGLGYSDTNMENCGSSGGLSAASVEVARALAALSIEKNNPMFDESTRLMLLKNATASTGHGFDWVGLVDAKANIYYGGKGGSLSTSQNAIYFTTHGLSYVICWNGPTPTGEAWYPSFNSVLGVAQSHDWGGVDLFPQYGMPSFDKSEPNKVVQVPQNLHLQPLPPRAITVLQPSLHKATSQFTNKTTSPGAHDPKGHPSVQPVAKPEDPKQSLKWHLQQLNDEFKNLAAGPVPPKPGDPNTLNPQQEPPLKPTPGDPGPTFQRIQTQLSELQTELKKNGATIGKEKTAACQTLVDEAKTAVEKLEKAKDPKEIATLLQKLSEICKALSEEAATKPTELLQPHVRALSLDVKHLALLAGNLAHGDPGLVIQAVRASLMGMLEDLNRGAAFNKKEAMMCKGVIEAAEKALDILAKTRDAKAYKAAHDELGSAIKAIAAAVTELTK
jgi:CubicO group peptidase (beta-lactamase class C family)